MTVLTIIIAISFFLIGVAVAWNMRGAAIKAITAKAQADMQSVTAKAEADLQAQKSMTQKLEALLQEEAQRGRTNLINNDANWKEMLIQSDSKWEKQLSDSNEKWQRQISDNNARWQQQLLDNDAKWQQRLDDCNKQWHQQLEDAERKANERLADSDKKWEAKLEAIKNEFLSTAARQAMASGEELRKSNTSSLNDILNPIKEQFEAFKKSVDESRTQSKLNKQEINDKFESTLRLFMQQQESTVKTLREETSKIGNDAVALAQALKGNSKKQGNWGEMVLQTLLENSGLEEGVHFKVQLVTKDDEGKKNIPDVVVYFPEGRSVIIDSKVSLTAYTRYFETEDEAEKESLLKEHLKSVEKHIDELSKKNYPRFVENSMEFVLMFIPNESSYIAAMKLNPNLLHDAYDKKVIVISPNNLLMALHLAYNMWQNDKQLKNVAKIVDRGRSLYEKFSNFQTSFDAIGDMIGKLQSTFNKANSQLSIGPGNVIRQCDQLREMGVQVDHKKRLKVKDDDSLPTEE